MERNVIVFEDDSGVIGVLTWFLPEQGYTVLAFIASMEEARKVIPTLDPKQIWAAIVDGDLSSNHDTKDGRQLVQDLRKKGIATVGFAGLGNIGADIEVGKDISGLPEALNRLR